MCSLVCTVLFMKQGITNLLFSHTGQYSPGSVPPAKSRQPAFHYPAQIPLNKATLLTLARCRLSALTADNRPQKNSQLASEHVITKLTQCYQTWNNCGPASLSMLLSCFEIKASQEEIAMQLRPHAEDKHTSIHELARYAENPGLYTLSDTGGSVQLVKELVAAGIPVMLKIGLDPDDDDWMCHYIIVTGYSDKKSEFILMDSLYGQYYPYSYQKTAEFWAHFMWTYLVVAPKQKQQLISKIINKDAGSAGPGALLQQRVYHDVTDKPESAFAWYNLGKLFLLTGQPNRALMALKTAYAYGLPWRLPWYDVGMYEIYVRNSCYKEVLQLTANVLSRNPYSEEARYYRAQALIGTAKKHAALTELDRALDVNPSFEPAKTLLKELKDAM